MGSFCAHTELGGIKSKAGAKTRTHTQGAAHRSLNSPQEGGLGGGVGERDGGHHSNQWREGRAHARSAVFFTHLRMRSTASAILTCAALMRTAPGAE